ncbi:hypothetical protein [Chryseobacterium aquifrigidense]|uniref:Uncharacterized protein n=1 Tax=Chryseobacterium aquifrigidense TaxID=558021 RepID=A0A543E9P9_9FLAO|nr:hypothetical protein [Chryseobacterium aquifrigidense]TQM18288.1 hypothetical protein FB551_4069 [Chryseobacterium aquifrigidense]
MSILDNSEKLMILVSISDRLWEDYKNGDLTESDYIKRSDQIRNEINQRFDLTFYDIQSISSRIGYMLIKKKNAFSTVINYKIAKN